MQEPQVCNVLGGSGFLHPAKFNLPNLCTLCFVSVRNLVPKVLCTIVDIVLIYAASSADMLMINFISYNEKKMVRLVIKWATANEVGDWLGHVVTSTWDFT